MVINIERLRKFSKDDIIVIFVPKETTWDEYQELAGNLYAGEIPNKVLILPEDFDVKKLKFIGVDGKEVDMINMTKDGTVEISFISPDSPEPEVSKKVELVCGLWYGFKDKIVKYLGEEDQTVCPPDITTFDPGPPKKVFEDTEGKVLYLDDSEIEQLTVPGEEKEKSDCEKEG